MLGLWIEQAEGAKFWLKVVNELKARGVNDILIAVVDGLKGFPEAITSVFPQTVVLGPGERHLTVARERGFREGLLMQGPDRRLGSIGDPNFAKYGLYVNLHGGLGNLQLRCDELVRCPLNQGIQNCGLAVREPCVWFQLVFAFGRLRLLDCWRRNGLLTWRRRAIPEQPFENRD